MRPEPVEDDEKGAIAGGSRSDCPCTSRGDGVGDTAFGLDRDPANERNARYVHS